MALKFYESPFHVTHSEDVASKMAMKMDLSIMLTSLIKEKAGHREMQLKTRRHTVPGFGLDELKN